MSQPRRHVLLVDDEPTIRYAMRRVLQRLDWTVDEAEDGRAALDRLIGLPGTPATTYDVIISDLRMPGISGIELYGHLERERPDLLSRLIVSTGDTVSPEAAAFLERSACPVLRKPFALAELRRLVAAIAER